MKPQRRATIDSRIAVICLLALAGAAFCAPLDFAARADTPAQTALTPAESRGKQIYTSGKSASGREILAYLGESSVEVPGATLPCANCHGLDGQGKPEGGVTPSNLTWEALTKPYGVKHASGREHPPYTERALELAITRGTDPAGNTLANVMPRYAMAKEDLADLILYLKRLGSESDPGIGDNAILIGMTIPNGALAEMGQAVKAVTRAYFEEVNAQGGVYNRRLELKVIETAETPSAKQAAVEHLLADDRVFALSSAFIAGAENEIVTLVAKNEVPLIGPITLYPQIGFPLNRQVFYLLSGIDGQSRALIDFVARRSERKNFGIAALYPRSEINESVVRAIADHCQKRGLNAPGVYGYAAGSLDVGQTIKHLRQDGREVIFFLGNREEVQSFMKAADQVGWYPTILQPNAGGGPEMFTAPMGFDGKLFFSAPTSPAAQSAQGSREFSALANKYGLSHKYLAAQFSAYSASRVLVEALKRVGRDVSREKLIQALEGLYHYATEVTPAITYSPNRRIGATGAYIVQIDLKEQRLLPASEWIEIN